MELGLASSQSLFHLLIIPTRATGNPELEAALLYQQIYLDPRRGENRGGGKRYTPKHGSWLNISEIEFSVLSRS